MKHIIFSLALAVLIFALSSCGDDYLDRENLSQPSTDNFYSTPKLNDQALNAVYTTLRAGGWWSSELMIAELMSDDRIGSGGQEDINAQGFDQIQLTQETLYDGLWSEPYVGIFRANMLIKNFDRAKYDDQQLHDQRLGEAYFLRAYLYFKLAKFFGTVPLIIDPETQDVNSPKASVDELYGQIASDLKKAIDIMPSVPYYQFMSGHATKWAAEALMARVWLFYTGVYSKNEMPLAEGGSVSKSQVQDWLVDLIENSGHQLASDFRNIWPYSANKDYKYAVDNNLQWIGEDESNTETIFAVKFTPLGGWGNIPAANFTIVAFGFRGLSNSPFGMGWGWAAVNPQLWDSFEPGDLRREGSIISLDTTIEGSAFHYELGGWGCWWETGYYGKKYVPVYGKNADGQWQSLYYMWYGGAGNIMLNSHQDMIKIRFADVLLMAAELGCPDAQTYFDMVRTRAGLASKPVTLDNIKEERRHELAGEGLRYFDLLRWGDVASAFAKVKNIPIFNNKAPDTYDGPDFRPETKGFLPIPPTQIRLSGGVLEQNPGW
ncbi:MAG: RagB/SusD family nutrient uptake outer membrane protein [Chlorobi bacterium]|nr:RagB/SusD family nutrient uptake outer membrane protein [Chlorobiota bacterium]